MKKKLLLLCTLLMVVLSLAGCVQEPKLQGRYTNSAVFVENALDFTKDGKVVYKVYAAGVEVLSEEGTYTINDDKTEITLNLPGLEQTAGSITVTILDVNGTFSYVEGDGYIQIGKIKYDKVTGSEK